MSTMLEPKTQEDFGFIHAFRGQRCSNTNVEYIKGYAQGYNAYLARTGRERISKHCFTAGYQDAVQKKQPQMQHQHYLEGYALACSDANNTQNKTLDDYFYVERDILLWKLTKQD
ncbi:hypothetical protein HY485_01990 [Candidatus Woesearchaeota archaeon]|nr:hypothetical protein [Candidatus Woesearchaeota archaeon]